MYYLNFLTFFVPVYLRLSLRKAGYIIVPMPWTGGGALRVIYADEVFLGNLIVDYLLLVSTGCLAGIKARRWRAALAAVLGGAYALTAAVFGGVWSGWAFKLTVGAIMVLAVFGASERLFRVTLLFFGLSAAFAGAVMACSLMRGEGAALGEVSFGALILAFALFYALFSTVFGAVTRRRVRGGTRELSVSLSGKTVRIPALLDTGNTLRSPLTGLPVAVCSLDAVAPLLPAEAVHILRSEPDVSRALVRLSEQGNYRFFPVPYRAVGVDGGMLPAFRPDSARLRGRELTVAIAVAPSGVGDGTGYSAIVGI